MKNRVVRLTEQDINHIIKESVEKIINENMEQEGFWDNVKAGASAIKAVKVLYVRPDEENNIGEQLSELEYPLELDEKIYKYADIDISCYVEANAEENYDPGDYITAPYYEIIDKPDVSDIVITVYKLRKDGVEEKTKYKGNEEIKKLLENKIEIVYPEDYFEKLYDTV